MVFLVLPLLLGLAAPQRDTPIRKESLINALKQLRRSDPQAPIIYQIQLRGVNFELTSSSEAELRRAGARRELIEAVRNNFRAPSIPSASPNVDAKPSSAVPNQTPSPLLFAATPTPTPFNPSPPTSTPIAVLTPPMQQPLVNRTNEVGIELIAISSGSFTMGSEAGFSDEQPTHQVKIGYSFYIGKYEVTQVQWKSVMGNNPSKFKGDNLPVERISWADAQEFVRKLNALNDGYLYRLPTEAEWEYACRAGTKGQYEGDLKKIAWYSLNSGNKTHGVGQKDPNAWNLFDMQGNVWEWCTDWYHESYYDAPTDGSAWLYGGERKGRVLRGGAWHSGTDLLTLTSRAQGEPSDGSGFRGLRVVAIPRTNQNPTTSTMAMVTSTSIKNQIRIEMVWISPGSFMMGSENGHESNKPAHRVLISSGFYLGKYEVTQAQWLALMPSNPSEYKGCDNCPVENISWNEVQQFIKKLNEMNDGYIYRLPSEAEWEYTCRAGEVTDHPVDLDSMIWYAANSGPKPQQVGLRQPNRFGLYDMLGNVWEWCQDGYDENYYRHSTSVDPKGSSNGERRVLRGQSVTATPKDLSCAGRNAYAPDGDRAGRLGFRVVAVPRTISTQ